MILSLASSNYRVRTHALSKAPCIFLFLFFSSAFSCSTTKSTTPSFCSNNSTPSPSTASRASLTQVGSRGCLVSFTTCRDCRRCTPASASNSRESPRFCLSPIPCSFCSTSCGEAVWEIHQPHSSHTSCLHSRTSSSSVSFVAPPRPSPSSSTVSARRHPLFSCACFIATNNRGKIGCIERR